MWDVVLYVVVVPPTEVIFSGAFHACVVPTSYTSSISKNCATSRLRLLQSNHGIAHRTWIGIEL